MPIKALIAQRAFSPEDVQVITDAYNIVVTTLNLQTMASKENAGKIVIHLAGDSPRLNAEQLAQSALRELPREKTN